NRGGILWGAYRANGSLKDDAHSTANYRRAFARIYLIVHGGAAAQVNAKLRALGLPPIARDLAVNPFPRVRVLWSPLAGGTPRVAGNAPAEYYPGPAYVDVDGGDIYDEAFTDTAPWPDLENLYKLALEHRRPFSVPEWGLFGLDDKVFVEHMCRFLKERQTTEAAVFYESKVGSIFDLESKPMSAKAYRP